MSCHKTKRAIDLHHKQVNEGRDRQELREQRQRFLFLKLRAERKEAIAEVRWSVFALGYAWLLSLTIIMVYITWYGIRG